MAWGLHREQETLALVSMQQVRGPRQRGLEMVRQAWVLLQVLQQEQQLALQLVSSKQLVRERSMAWESLAAGCSRLLEKQQGCMGEEWKKSLQNGMLDCYISVGE